MEIVLGVSMAPTTVRMVLIEGQNADGVTVEEDTFEVGAAEHFSNSGAADQVIGAIVGTREAASEGGYRLASTGVTWTDKAGVGGLRDALAGCDIGSVMLVSPLLAAAALARTVGEAVGYERIAMVFVGHDSATLAVVEIAGGSIVELHRRPLTAAGIAGREGAVAAELAAMVAGLGAPGSRADGVFIVGCGVDIVGIKAALEGGTALDVTAPEEPDLALARGAALASANAPLFASSTAALAYALDPGTGELNPGALSPTYLDAGRTAGFAAGGLAYSALDDVAGNETMQRRRPMLLAGSALAAIGAAVAGVVLVSLTSDQTSAGPQSPRVSVATPARQLPAQAPSAPPPAPEAVAPPAPPPAVQQAPPSVVDTPPAAPPHREPTRREPAATPSPAPQAPAPTPAAVPAPAPQYAPPAPAPQYVPPASPPQYQAPTRPPLTMYLHLPFVTVPIPINPPPPPAPAQ